MMFWDCLHPDLDTVTGECFTLNPIKHGCKHFYVTFRMEAINNSSALRWIFMGKKSVVSLVILTQILCCVTDDIITVQWDWWFVLQMYLAYVTADGCPIILHSTQQLFSRCFSVYGFFFSSLLRLMRRAAVSLCALLRDAFWDCFGCGLISRNARDPSQQLPINHGDSTGLIASERSIWSQSHFKKKLTHNYIMLWFLNHRSLFCFWVIV